MRAPKLFSGGLIGGQTISQAMIQGTHESNANNPCFKIKRIHGIIDLMTNQNYKQQRSLKEKKKKAFQEQKH